MRRRIVRCVIALLASGFALAAGAQSYPNRPVRVIIPFPPGGPTDLAARIVVDELASALAQAVVAENRPGAGGNIGAQAAAASAPDGYTLFWAQPATHGTNPSLYRQLRYDAVRDFEPIGLVATQPLVLVVNPAFPAADSRALVSAAKGQPEKFRFGSGGNGSTPHMAAELFAMMAGIKLVHVPYKGTAPALADTMGGQIDLVFDGVSATLGHIRAGRLKPLAVTGRERSPQLPHVPTVAETIPGYDVLSWGGLVAPAGTPREVIERLSGELVRMGKSPVAQERFDRLGMKVEVGTPEAMGRFIRAEVEKWRRVVEQAGTRLD